MEARFQSPEHLPTRGGTSVSRNRFQSPEHLPTRGGTNVGWVPTFLVRLKAIQLAMKILLLDTLAYHFKRTIPLKTILKDICNKTKDLVLK